MMAKKMTTRGSTRSEMEGSRGFSFCRVTTAWKSCRAWMTPGEDDTGMQAGKIETG